MSMNSIWIFGIIVLFSLFLSIIQFRASIFYEYEVDEKKQLKNSSWEWIFIEIWNRFITLFLGGALAYYFISARWERILKDGIPTITDFFIFIIFSMCMLGWLPILLKNLTEGINAILERLMGKKL
jgi:hypothetical protein